MTIQDGVTALPYIGEEPSAVLLFQDGVNTARGHIQTFSADLSSARSSTTTAWQATEATTADFKTSGIATSGEEVARSLDAGSKAVGLYSTVLTQGRRAVDTLRDEWNLARTQASALETRTITTPEEEATAKADVARLTEHFDEVQRQFKSVVTTVETAAAECSQALLTAAGSGSNRFQLASFLLDPPPNSSDEERWWASDKTYRHNVVKDLAYEKIKEWVESQDGDISQLTKEGTVKFGSKKRNGKDGAADILYVDIPNRKVYIWEVKGTAPDGGTRESAEKGAASDLAWYIPFLEAQYPGFDVQGGGSIGEGLSVDYDPRTGDPERLDITETSTPGAIIYDPQPRPAETSTIQTPSTAPNTPSEPPDPPPAEPSPTPTPPPPPSGSSDADQSETSSILSPNFISLDPNVQKQREDTALHLLSLIPHLLDPLGVFMGG